MHSKSDNTEPMIYDKAGEIIKELFDSLFLKISSWVGDINGR